MKLHVARRFGPGVLGYHLAEGLSIRPGIRAGPVVVIVPVLEHFQLFSVRPASNAEVLIRTTSNAAAPFPPPSLAS